MAKYIEYDDVLTLFEEYDRLQAGDLEGILDCLIQERMDEVAVEIPSPGWHDAKTDPPTKNGTYIVYAPTYKGGSSSGKENHSGIMFSTFKKGKWSVEHGYYDRPGCVTHWLPLPIPPTK